MYRTKEKYNRSDWKHASRSEARFRSKFRLRTAPFRHSSPTVCAHYIRAKRENKDSGLRAIKSTGKARAFYEAEALYLLSAAVRRFNESNGGMAAVFYFKRAAARGLFEK
ncbi:MAG: hypothetical protein Q4C72_08620 [Eubacteriales bacterium]|nr:hypothetical protein [Eubacteriales bacterium]